MGDTQPGRQAFSQCDRQGERETASAIDATFGD